MAAITGTFQADFAPFNQAVKEAEITIKSFEKNAGNVADKLEKIGNSFSGAKIIQEASLMAEAIERAGGVTTLTANELARASSVAAEAAEKLKALGLGVPQNIQALADAEQHATKSTDDLGVSFTKLVGSMISAEAIIGAVKAIWGGLTSEIAQSITAAQASEKVHVQLVAALKAQGTAVPSVVNAYTAYASALQQTTIYSDDAIKASETLLVLVGNVMPKDMEKALEATVNLASGLGKDLPEAAGLVAKAANGNTTALEKSGIALDAAKVKTEGFGYVLDQITAKFTGQAAALAGTYEGRLKQLANTWDSLHAAVGRVITQNTTVLSAIDAVNQMIASNTGELNDNATANALASDAVIAAARALGLAFSAAALLIEAYTNLRIAANLVGAATTEMAARSLDALGLLLSMQKYVNPLAWTDTFKAGVAFVKDAAVQLHGASEGFIADNAAAVNSGNQWAGAAERAAGGLATLAAKLETTRGQVTAIAPVIGTGSDAWDRNTEALERNKHAVEAYTAAWERNAEETAKIWADAFTAQAAVDQNSLASHLAVLEQRRQADIAEAERTIESADQLAERVYAIDAKYAALAVNETTKKNLEIQQQNEKLWNDYDELVGRYTASAYDKATQAIDAWYQETVTAAVKAGTATTEFWEVLTRKYVELWRQAGLDVAAINKTNQTETQAGLQATADAAKRQADYAITQVGIWSDETIQKYRDTYEAAQRAADNFGHVATDAHHKVTAATTGAKGATDALTGSLQTAAGAAKTLGDLMDAYFPQGTNGAARIGMYGGDTAGEAAYKAAGGIIHGPIGGLSTRAAGGPVNAATPYLVGESGPEVFMPAVAGNILANGARPSGGVVVNAPIYVNGTGADVARQVAAELLRTIKAGAQLAGV